MKRRSVQPKALRDRRKGMSPYARYHKVQWKYGGKLGDGFQPDKVVFTVSDMEEG